MTARKRTTTGKTQVKKLKLNRETIKDLDAKGKGSRIKGGGGTYPGQTMTNPVQRCHPPE